MTALSRQAFLHLSAGNWAQFQGHETYTHCDSAGRRAIDNGDKAVIRNFIKRLREWVASVAINNGGKTSARIVIAEGARAIKVQADGSGGSGVIRLGYGYRGLGANLATIRLTAHEAEQLVKALNANVDVVRGTPPCGRAALYGYHKKFTRQEVRRAELGWAYLRENPEVTPELTVSNCTGAVYLDGDYCRHEDGICLMADEAEELVSAINSAVDALGEAAA